MRFRRFWITIVGVLICAAVLNFLAPALSWSGGAVVQMDITVLDSATGAAVAGATVTCRQEIDLAQSRPARGPTYTTDRSGHVMMAWLFGAGGTKYLLFRTGSISFEGQMFVVEASGYRTLVCPVSDYTGSSRSLWPVRRIPPIILNLVADSQSQPG